MEPYNFFYGGWNSLGEYCHLSLKENEKDVWAPLANYIDGAVRDEGLVQGYCAPREKIVVSDLMGV